MIRLTPAAAFVSRWSMRFRHTCALDDNIIAGLMKSEAEIQVNLELLHAFMLVRGTLKNAHGTPGLASWKFSKEGNACSLEHSSGRFKFCAIEEGASPLLSVHLCRGGKHEGASVLELEGDGETWTVSLLRKDLVTERIEALAPIDVPEFRALEALKALWAEYDRRKSEEGTVKIVPSNDSE